MIEEQGASFQALPKLPETKLGPQKTLLRRGHRHGLGDFDQAFDSGITRSGCQHSHGLYQFAADEREWKES